jgi:hypothetical protein
MLILMPLVSAPETPLRKTPSIRTTTAVFINCFISTLLFSFVAVGASATHRHPFRDISFTLRRSPCCEPRRSWVRGIGPASNRSPGLVALAQVSPIGLLLPRARFARNVVVVSVRAAWWGLCSTGAVRRHRGGYATAAYPRSFRAGGRTLAVVRRGPRRSRVWRGSLRSLWRRAGAYCAAGGLSRRLFRRWARPAGFAAERGPVCAPGHVGPKRPVSPLRPASTATAWR